VKLPLFGLVSVSYGSREGRHLPPLSQPATTFTLLFLSPGDVIATTVERFLTVKRKAFWHFGKFLVRFSYVPFGLSIVTSFGAIANWWFEGQPKRTDALFVLTGHLVGIGAMLFLHGKNCVRCNCPEYVEAVRLMKRVIKEYGLGWWATISGRRKRLGERENDPRERLERIMRVFEIAPDPPGR
jgi:hypothetical protein